MYETLHSSKLAKTGHMWIYIMFSVFSLQSLASYEVQMWKNAQMSAFLLPKTEISDHTRDLHFAYSLVPFSARYWCLWVQYYKLIENK